MKLPMLYLMTPNGLSVFWPLVEYFKAHPNTSLSWARQTSRALGLLYDFSVAVAKLGLSRQELFRRFSLSLCHGTIDAETHHDKSGLYWAPSSLSVQKKMCSSITRFIAWKDEASCKGEPVFLKYLDEVPPSLKRLLTASKIASKSMLYHAKDVSMLAERLDRARLIFGMELGYDPRELIGNRRTVNDFPSELIPQLIMYGFIRDPHATDPFEREDITAKMITILLAGGGLEKESHCISGLMTLCRLQQGDAQSPYITPHTQKPVLEAINKPENTTWLRGKCYQEIGVVLAGAIMLPGNLWL
ncbi:hypothetical protein ACTG2C_01065 [Aeromonas veronii]